MARSPEEFDVRSSADAAAPVFEGESIPAIPLQRQPSSRTARASKILELLTVADVLRELQIARSTFYAWKAKGIAPNWRKLPNGELRISRQDLLTWYESLEVAN